MMPVIRISDKTWERLKAHARPLEDSVDDVLNTALDSLDKERGLNSKPKYARIPVKRKSGKLPQKEFRQPLLGVLMELGGSAPVQAIRKAMEPKIKSRLLDGDYEPVTTGEPRWWNAVCWERNDLVKEGLFRSDSPRGVWELSDAGRQQMLATHSD